MEAPASTACPGARFSATTAPPDGLLTSIGSADDAPGPATSRACRTASRVSSSNRPLCSKASMTPTITDSQRCASDGRIRTTGCPGATVSLTSTSTSSTVPETGATSSWRSPGSTSAPSKGIVRSTRPNTANASSARSITASPATISHSWGAVICSRSSSGSCLARRCNARSRNTCLKNNLDQVSRPVPLMPVSRGAQGGRPAPRYGDRGIPPGFRMCRGSNSRFHSSIRGHRSP